MDLASERSVMWNSAGSLCGPAMEAYIETNNYSGYDFNADKFSDDAKGELLAIDSTNEKFMIWTAK